MKNKIIDYYRKFDFPKEFDEQFYKDIENVDMEEISGVLSMESPFEYLKEKNDAFFNFALILARMDVGIENLGKCGVPQDIIFNSLSDITVWSKSHFANTGKVGIMQVEWEYAVAKGNMFKIGRLQFQMVKAYFASTAHGIKEGDDVINVHIQEGPGLTPEACRESFAKARKFFAKYFPEYNYKGFVCVSWLLNPTLLCFVKPDSNIASFLKMFDIVKATPSMQGRERVFGAVGEKLDDKYLPEDTSLQKKMKEFLINGGTLMSGYGVILP